jgi:hypothetical protein
MAAKLEATRPPVIYKRRGRYAVIYHDVEGRQGQGSARTFDEARNLENARTTAFATGEFHPAPAARRLACRYRRSPATPPTPPVPPL